MIIELANVKTVMVGKAHEMIGHGTEIEETEVAEATEKTEECRDVMLGVMTMNVRHEGTEIFLRVGWTEGQVPLVVEDLQEAIAMNSQCKWEVEIGKRVPVLHPKRRSLHLI